MFIIIIVIIFKNDLTKKLQYKSKIVDLSIRKKNTTSSCNVYLKKTLNY